MDSDTAKPIPPEILEIYKTTPTKADVVLTGAPPQSNVLHSFASQATLIRNAKDLETLERLMTQSVKFNANGKSRRRIQAAYDAAKSRLGGVAIQDSMEAS